MYKVEHFDLLLQVVSILQDPKLQDGFMTKPDVRGTDGDRVYGEMNTGVWWEEVAEKVIVTKYNN